MLVHDFAIIFGVATLTIILTSKLKLPSVLGYLLVGLIVGPYVPIPLFADTERIHQLSELGVILVMFCIGLEFRLRNILRIIPTAGLVGFIQVSLLFVAGTFLGNFFGWGVEQSFLLGASLAISSSMLVSKTFEDLDVPPSAKELIFGVLVIQDIFAIFIITVITGLSLGQEISFKKVLEVFGRLVAFIATVFAVGKYFIPRFVNYVLRFKSQEMVTIISCGICFTLAIFAESMGYSVALGAFLAGVLVGESGRSKAVELNITQLKSIFSAMFFISVGMTINPVSLLDNFDMALIISVVIIVFQFVANFISGILVGHGIQTSFISGISLGQIGEFSFIIAATGKEFNLVNEKFYSIIVAAAVITSITTPLLLRKRIYLQQKLESIIPKRLLALILIYLSWYNNKESKTRTSRIPIRRNMRHIIFTTAVMMVISTMLSVISPTLENLVYKINSTTLNVSEIYLVLEMLVLSPFVIYLLFCAYNLTDFILKDLWTIQNKKNYTYQVMIQIIRLGVLFILTMVSVLVLSPLKNISIYIFALFFVFACIVIFFFWNKTSNLQDQMEKALNRFFANLNVENKNDNNDVYISSIPQNIIPGLEELKVVKISQNSIAVEKNISSLGLKSKTGATIFAIIRNQQSISLPDDSEQIQIGDQIAIVGGKSSVAKAIDILTASL